MASVMAIGSEGFGRCVEGIRVEVGLKNTEALFTLPCIFCGLIRRLDGRKLRLICWSWCQVLEADLWD